MTDVPDKLGALRAALDILTAQAMAHAVIGGVAVGIRSGVPRATLDVDLAVCSRTDRHAVIEAFVAHGFRLMGEFPHSVNFRHATGEPVQLAFDPAFDAMLERAEPVDAGGGLSVPVVTTADLIAMKERAAADPARRRSKRLRDQADIALLRGDGGDPDEGW